MKKFWLLWAAAWSAGAMAQTAPNFPNRPIRMVAGMPAGGGADLNARRLAERLNKILIAAFGVTLIGGTPDSFAQFLAAEQRKFADLIKKQNIHAN
jgi:tripartite-type tricarboxylate transporter receptor subunit TctC